MAKTVKVLTDAKGREYPVSILDPELVKRNNIVQRSIDRAHRLNERIKLDKQRITNDVGGYLDKLAEQYDETWKGNKELISFDELKKVEIRNRDMVTFDPEIQLAKQKLEDFIGTLTKDSDPLLKELISDIFGSGKSSIPKTKLLSLKKYTHKNPLWKEAMELIDEALRISSTRTYVNVYERDSLDDPWRLINLNFSRA